MGISDKLLIEMKEYLENFIAKYKSHKSLHIIDISHHITQMRKFDKEMKKENKIK